jgi:hypothetical protein
VQRPTWRSYLLQVIVRPIRLLAFLGLLLGSTGSLAAPQRLPKVATVDVKATGTFDPKTVAGLSSFIAIEASRHPVKVISGAEVRTMLGFEKERALVGCTDSSCLVDVGGALGVDFLLVSEVSEVGGVWMLSLTLLDMKSAQAVGRALKRTRGTGDLVDLAAEAVAEVFARFAPPPRASRSAGTARTAGFVVGGVGLAVLAGGGASGFLAQQAYGQAEEAVKAGDAVRLEARKGAARDAMTAANVLYGVGGAAALTGVLLVILGGPSAPVAVAPAPGGGAVVTLGGTF